MSTDPHTTIRLEMFEVYEQGATFPLFATSDPTQAHAEMQPTDRLVRCWWVREGEK